MTVFRDKVLFGATLILLGCFVWSAVATHSGEECFINDQKRGVCRPYSDCPSATKREHQYPTCGFPGDTAYICCELPESESVETHHSRDRFTQKDEDSNEDWEQDVDIEERDENPPSENDESEVGDRIYNFNGHRNPWNRWWGRGRKTRKDPPKSGRWTNDIRDSGRRVGSNVYHTTNKPYRQQGENTNVYFENEKNTFNQNYQNHKTQENTGNWYQPYYQRPQHGHNNNGWQENQNYPGNYNNRRTTERPRTTTSSYVFPNQKPVTNRPQNFNSWNRPQNPYNTEYKPEQSNFGGNRPNSHIYGGDRPQKPSVSDSRPSNINTGGSRPQNNKRISELKCDEYAEAVTTKVSGLLLTTDPKPITINVEKCESAHQVQILVVGGLNTTIGEFPHMAALGYEDNKNRRIVWLCGGTLISSQYVLTAAHCTTSSKGKPVRVRLGEYNLNNDNDGAFPEDYSIAEVINHPEYKKPLKYNDIALLRLSRRVNFKKHIRPACLYTKREVSEPTVVALGWGKVGYDKSTSDVLLKVALNKIDQNVCNRAYYSETKRFELPNGIIDTQMCAGDLSGGKDTCNGDSGGPLEVTHKDNRCLHYVAGVTSFGKACGFPNAPGVYTRVSEYVPWIESVVWPQ